MIAFKPSDRHHCIIPVLLCAALQITEILVRSSFSRFNGLQESPFQITQRCRNAAPDRASQTVESSPRNTIAIWQLAESARQREGMKEWTECVSFEESKQVQYVLRDWPHDASQRAESPMMPPCKRSGRGQGMSCRESELQRRPVAFERAIG